MLVQDGLIGSSVEPIGGKMTFDWTVVAVWLDVDAMGRSNLVCACVSDLGLTKKFMFVDLMCMPRGHLP